MRIGSTGKAVLKLERQLETLGAAPGKVDGVFDRDTFDAVQRWKRSHPKLKVDDAIKKLSHAAYRARVKPTKERRRLDAATATAARQGITPGATGRPVVNIQARLERAGYGFTGKRGVYNEFTRAMVEQFQRKNGLPPSGTVDERTWNKLSKANLYAKNATSPAQRIGEKDRQVLETERMLKRQGFKVGRVDGLYDKNTARAVRRFQRRQLIKKEPGVGKKTLRALRIEDKLRGNKKLELVRDFALMAKRRGLPPELPIITALVESNFRNVNFGDRDSLGMFQQRAAWGPRSVRLNPIKSARMFFDGGRGGQRGAVDFKHHFKGRGPSAYGAWAQAVQVSAFPDRYQQRMGEARRLLRAAGIR